MKHGSACACSVPVVTQSHEGGGGALHGRLDLAVQKPKEPATVCHSGDKKESNMYCVCVCAERGEGGGKRGGGGKNGKRTTWLSKKIFKNSILNLGKCASCLEDP